MKKFLLPLFALVSFAAVAQDCSDLFISEYGTASVNNRYIEIYNPTANPISLANYGMGRFSNGSAVLTSGTFITLGSDVIPAYGTYVVVNDHRDTITGGVVKAGLEEPVWNGYNLVKVSWDVVNNVPKIGANGDTLYYAKTYKAYPNSSFCWQNTYNARWDLQGKANLFVCPVYNTNNMMYQNGDDAMALVKGNGGPATVTSTVIDAVGVIGDASIVATSSGGPGPGYWSDPNATGYAAQMTKNRTLVRRSTIKQGKVLTAANNDVFNAADWKVYNENVFDNVGKHTCDCKVIATQSLNEIPFRVFPNPVRGTMTVNGTTAIRSIAISNILGQTVLTQAMSGETMANVNTATLVAGAYSIAVTFEGGQTTIKKFIVE